MGHAHNIFHTILKSMSTEERRLEFLIFDPFGPETANVSSTLDTRSAVRKGIVSQLKVPKTVADLEGSSLQLATLPPLETLILSAGCIVHHGADWSTYRQPSFTESSSIAEENDENAAASIGWLCVSHSLLTFINLGERVGQLIDPLASSACCATCLPRKRAVDLVEGEDEPAPTLGTHASFVTAARQ